MKKHNNQAYTQSWSRKLKNIGVVLLLMMGMLLPIFGQEWAVTQTLLASDGAANGQFGFAVDISGDKAVVTKSGYGNLGAAYVYERQSNNDWVFTQQLSPSDRLPNESIQFGFEIAMDQDKIVVGAAFGIYNGMKTGAAYVYELNSRGEWEQTDKLVPEDIESLPTAATLLFGTNLAISGDWMLIGMIRDARQGTNSGSVYLYHRQANKKWEFIKKFNPEEGSAHAKWGAVSLDGNRALIGAYGEDGEEENSGRVYVIEQQSNGEWIITDSFKQEVEKRDATFGGSVSLDGNRALVGAPNDDRSEPNLETGSAYIFERQADGSWKQMFKMKSDLYFGWDVALEGNIAAISSGIQNTVDEVSIHIFERQEDGTWLETGELQAPESISQNTWSRVAINGGNLIFGNNFDNSLGTKSGAAYIVRNVPLCTVVNTYNDAPGSLRDLIVNHPECDVIYFDQNLAGKTITLTSGQILIERDVEIQGLPSQVRVSGNDQSRIFEIAEGKKVSLHKLRLMNGKAEIEGGAILNHGDLKILDSNIEYNQAVPTSSSSIASGGGIQNKGQLDIRRSHLDNNSAYSGGAINNDAFSSIYGESLQFHYNTASNFSGGAVVNSSQAQAHFHQTAFSRNNGAKGGAVFNQGTLNLTSCTIIENEAERGGAIHNSRSSGQLTLSGSVLKKNEASEQGGAIWTQTAKLTIKNSSVNENGVTSTGESCKGGAIYIDLSQVNISNSSLNTNYLQSATTVASGGAIYNVSGELYLDSMQINSNMINSQTSASGAAMYNNTEATARLTYCHISSNKLTAPTASGGAITNRGDLYIEESTIFNNSIEESASAAYGGGIRNSGNTYITSTYIGSNVLKSYASASGGGIHNYTGHIEINNSRLTANKALSQELSITTYGGGIYNEGGNITMRGSTMNLYNTATHGGAFYNKGGNFELINSTFSGNKADKGAALYNDVQGIGNARFTTISANLAELSRQGVPQGGGIFNEGQFEPINTIIAGNFRLPMNSDKLPSDVYGSLQSGGHNLIGVDDFDFSPAEGDLFGTITEPLDPLLEALADNGGPTYTHALTLCSPAVDAGTDLTGIATDQRGYERNIGANDIGAYEWGADESIAPGTTLVITEVMDGAAGSLRNMVEIARPGDTLVFASHLEGSILRMDGDLGEIHIDKPLTIQGPGAHLLSLQMELALNQHARFFSIGECAKVELSGLTLKGGSAPIEGPQTDYFSRGGAIYNQGGLYMKGVVLTENFSGAKGSGGGIYNDVMGEIMLEQSSIYANRVSGYGGGVYNLGQMAIVNTTIAKNEVSAQATDGVGIYNEGNMIVNFCTIVYNHALASSRGIGIYNSGELSLSNSILAHNTVQIGPDPNNLFVKDGFNEVNGILNDLGYNLIGDNTTLQLANAQNNILNKDPLLEAFVENDNYPPFYPLNGWDQSPCIEAANPTDAPIFDQRGIERPTPAGGKPDIGAYELVNPLTISEGMETTSIHVYPNPSTDQVWIEMKEKHTAPIFLSVRNHLGQRLMYRSLQNKKEQIGISRWPAGVYYLIFTYENGEVFDNAKLIKY